MNFISPAHIEDGGDLSTGLCMVTNSTVTASIEKVEIFCYHFFLKLKGNFSTQLFKKASMRAPGRGGTSHLTDFNETWTV